MTTTEQTEAQRRAAELARQAHEWAESMESNAFVKGEEG